MRTGGESVIMRMFEVMRRWWPPKFDNANDRKVIEDFDRAMNVETLRLVNATKAFLFSVRSMDDPQGFGVERAEREQAGQERVEQERVEQDLYSGV